jgi:hypothetical protein
MSTINPFKRLLELLPSSPLQKGQIAALHADGTATVTLAGSTSTLRVRNPQGLASGAHVFVQDGAITGSAPALPVVTFEI